MGWFAIECRCLFVTVIGFSRWSIVKPSLTCKSIIWSQATVLGKHCECIAQKCTHLERPPPLTSYLLLLRHCVLMWHLGKKNIFHDKDVYGHWDSNQVRLGFDLNYWLPMLCEKVVPYGLYCKKSSEFRLLWSSNPNFAHRTEKCNYRRK